ncbi:MAG: hypothetical protein MK078_03340 [Crocinitomicaceae bacterium]|nr:hypothetical protein [Crocinitomicaceae bacterium]
MARDYALDEAVNMSQRISIIDLGTNTFNLLVVELNGGDSYEVLHSSKIAVGLGLGGIHKNRIADDAFQRGVKALKQFKDISEGFNVVDIRGIGTSALRNAKNGEEFKQEVKDSLGIDIQIISGDEEAKLIYKGAFLGYYPGGKTLIMDIGGGSTEFILCDEGGIIKSQSFEIGVARILQQTEFADPYTEDNCEQVRMYLDKALAKFLEGLEVDLLTGTSGSFETFYSLINTKEYPPNEYQRVDREELLKTLNQVIGSTYKSRVDNEFIIPIRERMLPIAALKVKYIVEKIKCSQVLISPYSLKEGILNKCLQDVK